MFPVLLLWAAETSVCSLFSCLTSGAGLSSDPKELFSLQGLLLTAWPNAPAEAQGSIFPVFLKNRIVPELSVLGFFTAEPSASAVLGL